MTVEHLLQEKCKEILRIVAGHGAHNVRIFASAVRGEAGGQSDIDLLLDFESERSLLDQVSLIVELEELMACKVDMVTEGGPLLVAAPTPPQGGAPAVTIDPRVYLGTFWSATQRRKLRSRRPLYYHCNSLGRSQARSRTGTGLASHTLAQAAAPAGEPLRWVR